MPTGIGVAPAGEITKEPPGSRRFVAGREDFMRVRFSRAPIATAALLCGAVMLLPFARSSVGYATSHLSIVSRAAVPSACQSDLTTASQSAVVACLRQQVKYVFVLYQENRSFDSYFSTFPGAQGIYSQPASQTPGYYQAITNTDGTASTIQPFRIGPSQFAADTDDIDHSHGRIDAKMDVVNGAPQMDKFAAVEEQKYTSSVTPSLLAKQYGELSMAYEDCDTVPLLWSYAKNFTLMDNIYQQMTGPSTPGNLAIIGAQTGQTQQIRHPDQAVVGTGDNYANPGVPVLNDLCPHWGGPTDPYANTTGIPYNSFKECRNTGSGRTTTTQINLTYPTLPVSFAGPNAIKTFNDTNDLGGGSDIADLNASVVSGTQTLSDTGGSQRTTPRRSRGVGIRKATTTRRTPRARSTPPTCRARATFRSARTSYTTTAPSTSATSPTTRSRIGICIA